MQTILKQTYQTIENAVSSCSAKHLTLSGGLDSTILAYFLRKRKINSVAVIAKDFVATDLMYCQMAAKTFGLPLLIKMCNTEEILQGIEETIKILENFNDIEIRNNVVMYLALRQIKQDGFDKVITGDGADELFAGYNFLLNKDKKSLESDLRRISKIMHFPSHKIGLALGVKIESPFCSKEVIEFAKNISTELLIRIENDKKFGKWILRKAFEDNIPKAIVWRQKSPMQDGSGMYGLTGLFNNVIPDRVFLEKTKKIKEVDNITLRTKESLYYYEIYQKYCNHIVSKSESQCPDCHYAIERNSRFCRMCGRFPI